MRGLHSKIAIGNQDASCEDPNFITFKSFNPSEGSTEFYYYEGESVVESTGVIK